MLLLVGWVPAAEKTDKGCLTSVVDTISGTSSCHNDECTVELKTNLVLNI